jgi:hypothetical protein
MKALGKAFLAFAGRRFCPVDVLLTKVLRTENRRNFTTSEEKTINSRLRRPWLPPPWPAA